MRDEEDAAQDYTSDRKLIQQVTAQTDLTYFIIGKPQTDENGAEFVERIGWIALVHGNDEDVISDCGAPTGEKLDLISSMLIAQ